VTSPFILVTENGKPLFHKILITSLGLTIFFELYGPAEAEITFIKQGDDNK
jgi:hypothetical protein